MYWKSHLKSDRFVLLGTKLTQFDTNPAIPVTLKQHNVSYVTSVNCIHLKSRDLSSLTTPAVSVRVSGDQDMTYSLLTARLTTPPHSLHVRPKVD